jgi:hypothetical protein
MAVPCAQAHFFNSAGQFVSKVMDADLARSAVSTAKCWPARAWCRWEAPSSRHYTDSAAFSYNPSFNRAVKRNVERVNSSLGRVHFRNPFAALLVSRLPFCWLRSCGVLFELAVERCFANP